MANHIINLQNKNAALEKQLAEINQDITNFMVYLNSSKFHTDTKIQAEEVYIRMREIRQMTLPQ
jgi:hypothetical protein